MSIPGKPSGSDSLKMDPLRNISIAGYRNPWHLVFDCPKKTPVPSWLEATSTPAMEVHATTVGSLKLEEAVQTQHAA